MEKLGTAVAIFLAAILLPIGIVACLGHITPVGSDFSLAVGEYFLRVGASGASLHRSIPDVGCMCLETYFAASPSMVLACMAAVVGMVWLLLHVCGRGAESAPPANGP